VYIVGEPGIGKSRLLDTMEGQIASERDSWVATARCSAYQRNSAFYPIIEWLEEDLMEFETKDDPSRKLAKLEQFLKSWSLDQEMALPLLAEFLSIPSDQHIPLMISPVAKRQGIMDALTQVVLAKASNQPVLFAIEDLHWADASTLEWLNHLITQIVGKNILIICSARPGFQPAWNVQSDIIREMTLPRLSADSLEAICHHQAKGKALPKDILRQISLKTDGVPLFVEELTKMIIESGLMVEKSDGFEVVGSVSSMSIPSTLQDSLLARLDKLSNSREIVQIASVLGRQFSEVMLSAVVPEAADRMTASLSQLVEAEIFYQRDLGKQSGYEFKHALIQDAAYESILKSRRQELHQKVAEVLEQQFAETTQTQPELLAHHYTEAGQPLKAIPIWLEAGQLASQKNAAFEANSHLEKGITLLPHVADEAQRNNLELDFRLILGGSYVVSHGFPHPKVKETFNRARDIAQSIEVNPKLALVLFNLLSYYFNTEDFKAHKALSDHMMKLAKDPANGYWFELFCHQILGVTRVIQGDFVAAKSNFERVLEMFNPSLPFPWELAPSGYIEVGAKGWSMVCLQILGFMDQAKSLSNNHLLFSETHKDSMTQYHIHTFPALLALVRRSWKEAEVIMEKYLPVVRAFGDPVFVLTADVYNHIAKAFLGDRASLDAAVTLTNVCFDVGFTGFAVSMSPYLGELYCQIGEYQQALDWVEKILAHVNRTGSHINTSELNRIKGVAQLALGKSASDVEKSFALAVSIAREQSAKTFELRAATELAKLWAKQNKSREARNLLKEVYEWFKEGSDTIDLKEGRVTLEQLKI
jgi:tetratricopeptide (TPR) repeat protein